MFHALHKIIYFLDTFSCILETSLKVLIYLPLHSEELFIFTPYTIYLYIYCRYFSRLTCQVVFHCVDFCVLMSNICQLKISIYIKIYVFVQFFDTKICKLLCTRKFRSCFFNCYRLNVSCFCYF